MIRAEMMDRMPAAEFYQWASFHKIQSEPQSKEQQTPEQMLAVMDDLGARHNARK